MPQALGHAGKLTYPNIGLRSRQLVNCCGFAVFAIVAMLFAATHVTAAPSAQNAERTLRMHNIHTKEDITIVYKRNGEFVPDALSKLDHFMRDWRRNATIKIEPELYDIIWELHRELGSKVPVHLICGHRSSATNEGLRRTRGGQARGSLHIVGKAADIQFPDISPKQLRNSALILERGGVGYYPSSSIPFVHVDTGRVRHWPRIARPELAVLFPAGDSKHVPSDGRPLTQGDFRVAVAALHGKGNDLPPSLQRRLKLGTTTAVASAEPEVLAPQPAVADGKPKFLKPTFASLTPSLGGSKSAAPAEPRAVQQAAFEGEARPIVKVSTQPTSARPDAAEFAREVIDNKSVAPAPDVEAEDDVEYDDEEIADELEYQPYPALSFMGETPVAEMDLTSPPDELTPARVMLMIGETRDMLHQEFQPGMQTANLAWAKSFRGTAVNTALRRVDRDNRQQPVKTAQAGK